MTQGFMLRGTVLAAALLLAGAASPYPPPNTYVQPFGARPQQPPPAPSRVSEYDPAPVPNQDLDSPARRAAGPAHAELTPGIYRPGTTLFQGDGYTPNSTVQGEQERHYHPAPQLSLSVPLE